MAFDLFFMVFGISYKVLDEFLMQKGSNKVMNDVLKPLCRLLKTYYLLRFTTQLGINVLTNKKNI
jgi:hypothetical protein